jgi:hypothetical protein
MKKQSKIIIACMALHNFIRDTTIHDTLITIIRILLKVAEQDKIVVVDYLMVWTWKLF